MSDTPITPSAGAITLAGVALTLVAGTVTLRGPSVGAIALAGVAPSLVQQQQAADTATTINLLKQDSVSGILKRWPGGAGVFTATGVFGGATVTFQYQGPDNASMVPVSSATTLTAAGMGTFHLPPGLVNAAISSASGTTAITAAAIATPTMIG